MGRRINRRRYRLELTRDLYRRRKIMLKRYSNSEIKKLAAQYGFDDVNNPKLINLLVPPGSQADRVVGINEDDKSDVDNPEAYKKKNKNPKQLIQNNLEEPKFTDSGTPIGDIQMDVIRANQYHEILKSNGSQRDMEHPILTIPEPTDDEISTGFMYRYFLQQANSPSAPIIEVDKEQYEGWLKIGGGIDRSFYNGVLLKWRIRGRLESIVGEDNILRRGVLEGNQNSINLASERLPALKNQITNLVKFWTR